MLLPLTEYRQQRQHVFRSDQSLRWFIRTNRPELIKRQALVMPTGHPLIAPAVFDQAVLDIGARKAGANAEAPAS